MNSIAGNGIETGHYRLITERRKTRMKREAFEKNLRTLHREEQQLRKQKRALGWVDLDSHVVRGWKRFFVLRDNVARSKQAEFFEGILKKINTEQWSYRKDFKVKKRKYGRKIYVIRQQHLINHRACDFNKQNFNEAEKQFFYPRYEYEKGSGKLITRYVFTDPWRFVLRTRPNIITKTRVRDEAIESRQREIDNYIKRNGLDGTIGRLVYGYYNYRWYWTEREWEKDPYKNRPLEWILDDVRASCL